MTRAHLRRVGIVLVIGLGLVSIQIALQPDIQESADCDLNLGSCSTRVNSGQVMLAITPRPIRPLKPLQAVVTLQGVEAKQIELVFTGVDVDMGRFAYPLIRTESGRFEGRVTLSICSQKRMIWQALVIIDEKIRLPFRFESEYKSQFLILE